MNVFSLFGEITLKGIKTAEGQLDSLGTKFKKVGDQMTRTGRTMTMYVTAPILALGTASFKLAGDFDQAFRKVNVMLGASADEAIKYKERILEISQATNQSATDVTEAFYQIVSAGYRGADSLDILETAMRGATGGAAEAQRDRTGKPEKGSGIAA